jgi:hypothetical protein
LLRGADLLDMWVHVFVASIKVEFFELVAVVEILALG